MKMSLRNFAFVGALALAGAAMAQEAPFTVTTNWFNTHEGYTINEYRFGTGCNGKVYLANKTAQSIDVYGPDGMIESIPASVALNVTHDDAGNLLWHGSWPSGTADGTTWYIMTPDKEIHTTTFNAPDVEGWASRMDYFGRVVGDMMSEEGALVNICPNTCSSGYMVYFKNGQIEAELPMTDYADWTGPYTFDSTTIAQPRYTFEELVDMGDDAVTAYAVRARGQFTPSTYADGEWSKFALEGAKSSEGFDCFYLQEKEYFVVPCGAVNYTTRFAICDAEGTIYWQSPEDHELSTAAGQGFGAITANVVSDSKVEIYICGKTNANTPANAALGYCAAPAYSAMYTVDFGGEEPAPAPLYLCGEFQGWNPAEPVEAACVDGVYTYTFPANNTIKFKMSTTKGADWKAFEAGVICIADDVVIADNTGATKYDLYVGGNAECSFAYADGQWTINVDLVNNKIWATNATDKPTTPAVLYLRGSFNGWGYNDDSKFATEDGVAYTLEGVTLEAGSEFKIADSSWGISLGGATNIEPNTEVVLSNDGGACNCTLACDVADATFKFNLETKVLVVEYTAPAPAPQRAAFAYGISLNNDEITYSLNADAVEVNAILTDVETGAVTPVALSGIEKGNHTEKITGVHGSFTVALEVISSVAGDGDLVEVYAETEHTVSAVRGGAVVINDPEYDSFGMVAVGHGKAQGIDLYNQAGDYVGRYHADNTELWTASNQSSVFRGDDRKGTAVFADWSDKGSGAWVFDPMNPETTPYNLLRPEGCNVESSGLVTLADGTATAGGTSCVSFYGKGEDEVMWFYEEDNKTEGGNLAKAYKLGGQDYLMSAASFVSGVVTAGWFANTNVELVQVNDYGYFASQCRAVGSNTAGCPAFAFIPFFEGEDGAIEEGARIDCINGAEIYLDEVDAEGNPVQAFRSCAGTIAINPAGDLFAVAEYTGISVATLDWNEYNEPVITRFAHIDLPQSIFADIDFDYANNLHVYFRDNGGYKVYALTGENLSVTPAKAGQVLNVISDGVSSIFVDQNNGPVVYYNLNGQRVSASNLTTGVYVRVNGNKAEKVIVK